MGWAVDDVSSYAESVLITARAVAATGACPLRAVASSRVHGRYIRSVSDLPSRVAAFGSASLPVGFGVNNRPSSHVRLTISPQNSGVIRRFKAELFKYLAIEIFRKL